MLASYNSILTADRVPNKISSAAEITEEKNGNIHISAIQEFTK